MNKGEICQPSDAWAEFGFKMKSVLGISALTENLCPFAKSCFGTSSLTKGDHQGYPLLCPRAEMPLEASLVSEELAARRAATVVPER